MRRSVGIGILVVVLLLTVAPSALSSSWEARPVVDPHLQEVLPSANPMQSLPIILSFWRPEDRSLVDGFAPHYKFRALPMASAMLSPAQIAILSSWPQIRSIWYGSHEIPILLAEGRELVQAPQATETFGVTGEGVTVAVIDTGVDTLHPDFSGRARNLEVEFGPAGTCTFVEVPNSDDIGHGTHVAGTIAGNGALSGGKFMGVAPDARIVSYDTNAGLFIITAEAICSYDHIIATKDTTGVRHISNSWGGGDGSWDRDNPIEIAIRAAYANGIASVFAAGNSGPADNTMSRQSVSPYSIGVGAITKGKQIVGFSSRGRPLDWTGSDRWPVTHDRDIAQGQDIPLFRPAVSAPGVRITAPVPCSPICVRETGYGTLSGTSMATPHASGVLALVLQMNPGLSPRQMVGVLEATATVLPDWLAWETGAGLANALQAVELAARLLADPATDIPDPTLDEALTSAGTTRTRQGPVMIIGSAPSAEPGSCPTPSICRDFFVQVPQGATRLFVRVEWTTSANNFYGFAFAPGQSVTDFPVQEDTGLLDLPINERILDIRMPAPGEWRIRVLPRANTIDFVALEVFVSRP